MPIHEPVSEHTSKSLDSDGEVQASLVVAQLERRRPEAFAHSRRVAQLAVRVGRLLVYMNDREALDSFVDAWHRAEALADKAFGTTGPHPYWTR